MKGPIKLLPIVYQASARKVDRAGVLEDAGKLSPLQRNLASELGGREVETRLSVARLAADAAHNKWAKTNFESQTFLLESFWVCSC
jgi:hypothetical protein